MPTYFEEKETTYNNRKMRHPEGSDHIATMRLMLIKDIKKMEKDIKDRQELIALQD